MSKNNNIDDLFKSKLYSKEFEFDPSAWADAEKLLDQHDNPKGGYWRKSLYGLIALLFISGSTYYGLKLGENDHIAEQNSVNVENSFNTDRMQEKNSQNVLSKVGIEEVNTRGESQKEKGEFSASSTVVDGQGNSQAEKDEFDEEKNRTMAAKQDQQETTKKKRKNRKQLGFSEKLSKSGSSSAESKFQPTVKNEAVYSQGVSQANGRGNSEITAPKGSLKTTNPVAAYQVSLGNQDDRNKKNKRLSEKYAVNSKTAISSSIAANMRYMQLEKMIPLKPEVLNDDEKDILNAKIKLNSGDDRFSSNSPLNGWGLIAGYGVVDNIQSSSDRSNSVANSAFAGVRYALILNSRYALVSNLVFSQWSGLGADVTFNSSEFDFGFDNETTTITAKTLQHISLPIYLNAYMGGVHNVYGGMQYSLLLNTISDKKTATENSFESFSETVKNAKGYKKQFNPHYVSLVLGYEYMLNEQFNIGLRFNYGLNDITKDKYFNDGARRINSLQLTMSYNLLK